jgi:hypothetical protein
VPATLARAEGTAAQYRALTADVVVPAVEIIATIASAGPGDDGNSPRSDPVEELRAAGGGGRGCGHGGSSSTCSRAAPTS